MDKRKFLKSAAMVVFGAQTGLLQAVTLPFLTSRRYEVRIRRRDMKEATFLGFGERDYKGYWNGKKLSDPEVQAFYKGDNGAWFRCVGFCNPHRDPYGVKCKVFVEEEDGAVRQL